MKSVTLRVPCFTPARAHLRPPRFDRHLRAVLRRGTLASEMMRNQEVECRVEITLRRQVRLGIEGRIV